MIYKWNEIDLEMFLEVFDSFWNWEDWSKDLVLEVQNIPAIISNCPDSRIYFSRKINISDFKDDNKNVLGFLNSAKKLLEDNNNELSNFNLSMCILDNKQVRIVPASEGSYDVIKTCFGYCSSKDSSLLSFVAELMSLWYIKKDGVKYIDMSKGAAENYKNSQKLIRMRTMDFKDWLNIIKEYKATGNIKGTDEDFKISDIEILNKLPSEKP